MAPVAIRQQYPIVGRTRCEGCEGVRLIFVNEDEGGVERLAREAVPSQGARAKEAPTVCPEEGTDGQR